MAKVSPDDFKAEDFYSFKVKVMWRYFWSEHPAFWCICGYLFIEYFKPQAIYPAIDVLPWAQVFLILSMVFAFFDKKSKFYFNSSAAWLVAFAVQIHISIFFAYSRWWSDHYYISFIQWFVIFFLITSIISTKERLYVFVMIFFLCSLKLSIGTSKSWAMRGFSFTSWGLMGPPGYFQNSGELAIQMVIMFCLSYFLIQRHFKGSGFIEKSLLILGIVTPVTTIMGASSRGSQIAFAFIIVMMNLKRIFKIKTILLIAGFALAISVLIPEEQKDRFTDMGEDRTSQQRLLYWEHGIEMIKGHPWTGVGYFNFIPYFSDFYPEDVLFVNPKGERVAELPHNILIQVGTDAGYPGLIFYLFFVASVLNRARKVDGDLAYLNKGFLWGIVGFFLAGQFVTVAYYPFLWISSAILNSSDKIHVGLKK